jgi:hypothetical protein
MPPGAARCAGPTVYRERYVRGKRSSAGSVTPRDSPTRRARVAVRPPEAPAGKPMAPRPGPVSAPGRAGPGSPGRGGRRAGRPREHAPSGTRRGSGPASAAHCGARVAPGSRFCMKCRKRVVADTPGTVRPSAAPPRAPGPPRNGGARASAVSTFTRPGIVTLLGVLNILGGVAALGVAAAMIFVLLGTGPQTELPGPAGVPGSALPVHPRLSGGVPDLPRRLAPGRTTTRVRVPARAGAARHARGAAARPGLSDEPRRLGLRSGADPARPDRGPVVLRRHVGAALLRPGRECPGRQQRACPVSPERTPGGCIPIN